MNITIVIPMALRRFVDGAEQLQVDADRVGVALEQAGKRYPKLGAQLFSQSGKLRGFILVFVNAQNIKHLQHEETSLAPGDRISLLPAIAGG